jgi:hypothetical protein
LNLQSKRAAQRRVDAMNKHNSIAVGTAAMLCGRVAGLLNLTGRSASVCIDTECALLSAGALKVAATHSGGSSSWLYSLSLK